VDELTFLEDPRIWLIIVGFFVMYVLGMPFLVKQEMRFRINFSIDEIDPEKASLPEEALEWLEETDEQLTALGFEKLGDFSISDCSPSVITLLSMYENHAQQNSAMVVTMFKAPEFTTEAMSVREKYVEFSTEYTDGAEICTNNSRHGQVFMTVPRKRVTRLPETRDLETLYTLHLHLLERYGTPPKRRLPQPEEWPDIIRDDFQRDYQEQVEAGMMETDEHETHFLLTWKGAYLMSWKLMWPFAQITRARRRLAAQELLEEFSHF